MYGFSDHPNAMPFTRLSAALQGSSRYSIPTSPRIIEHTFVERRQSCVRSVRFRRRPRELRSAVDPLGRRAAAQYARARTGRDRMTLGLELLALLGLLVLNAFFVAAEYGLVTARRTRIMELGHQGDRRARAVLRITSQPPRFISAMQLGVTLTSLAIGAVGEPVFAHVFDPVMATVLAVILALLVITYMHVVIGELVPKGIALGNPERIALTVSPFVRAFFFLLAPLIW